MSAFPMDAIYCCARARCQGVQIPNDRASPTGAALGGWGMSARVAVGGPRARSAAARQRVRLLPPEWSAFARRRLRQVVGLVLLFASLAVLAMLLSYDQGDPSWSRATGAAPFNLFGRAGGFVADFLWLWLGLAAPLAPLAGVVWGVRAIRQEWVPRSPWRLLALPLLVMLAALSFAAGLPSWDWQASSGAGGIVGDSLLALVGSGFRNSQLAAPQWSIAMVA